MRERLRQAIFVMLRQSDAFQLQTHRCVSIARTAILVRSRQSDAGQVQTKRCLFSYTKIRLVIYDSGPVPRGAIFSSCETSPEVGMKHGNACQVRATQFVPGCDKVTPVSFGQSAEPWLSHSARSHQRGTIPAHNQGNRTRFRGPAPD
jgi:hypothetical protein